MFPYLVTFLYFLGICTTRKQTNQIFVQNIMNYVYPITAKKFKFIFQLTLFTLFWQHRHKRGTRTVEKHFSNDVSSSIRGWILIRYATLWHTSRICSSLGHCTPGATAPYKEIRAGERRWLRSDYNIVGQQYLTLEWRNLHPRASLDPSSSTGWVIAGRRQVTAK